MEATEQLDSWTRLEQLVDEADPQAIEAFLESLPAGEAVRTLSRMHDDARTRLLTLLPPDEAAYLFEAMSDAQAVDLMEHLEPQAAAAIVHEMPSNEKADLLGGLDAGDAEAILAELETAEADELRQLREYPDHVAGGLMATELLAFAAETTVAEVIDDLRANADTYRDYQVQYVFVTDEAGKLIGVLRLRDLLLARPKQPVRELMIANPVTVLDQTNLGDLRDFFDEHDFLGAPVVREDGALLGLVRRAAVEEALGDRADDAYRKSQGIVREELRSMPLVVRSRRRLAWLSVNILLNVVAASVIAFYQDTLAQVIALAVFLPIISDMSGCSGNQAVAVSMRELALGLARPRDMMHVLGKEVALGVVNGLALGLLIAAVAFCWQGNPYLGFVVGAALGLNTLLAVSLGGILPLLMNHIKLDPALASGPILTTLTDMCGFFLVLSLAAALLPWLTSS